MKYLLLLAVLALLWSLWKKRRDAPPQDVSRSEPPPLNMQICAHCGVHFPENEGVRDELGYYCCEAHRQAARSAGR